MACTDTPDPDPFPPDPDAELLLLLLLLLPAQPPLADMRSESAGDADEVDDAQEDDDEHRLRRWSMARRTPRRVGTTTDAAPTSRRRL